MSLKNAIITILPYLQCNMGCARPAVLWLCRIAAKYLNAGQQASGSRGILIAT
jgi:hypothetical protein